MQPKQTPIDVINPGTIIDTPVILVQSKPLIAAKFCTGPDLIPPILNLRF
jgi:hypothetical protein